MTIRRFGADGGKGTGGQPLPFARAVAADGWLYVSGQTPMENGEVVAGGIVAQAHKAINNLLGIFGGGRLWAGRRGPLRCVARRSA